MERIEDLDINPHNYEHLNFVKKAKNYTIKNVSIFSKWCWHNWMATCERMKIKSASIAVYQT